MDPTTSTGNRILQAVESVRLLHPTPADIAFIHDVAQSVIAHHISGSNKNKDGITDEEAAVVLFDKRRALVEDLGIIAQEICNTRSTYTTGDIRILREYNKLFEEQRSQLHHTDIPLTERESLVVFTLARQAPTDVIDSGATNASRTSLSVLESTSGITDFIDGGNANSAVVQHVQCHQLNLPTLPRFTELTSAHMPNSLEDVQLEIEQRLEYEETVSLWLIRNRGLLWRLKMKKDELRER